MQAASKTYKFIGTILPDGHLSLPDEVAKGGIKEFEVTMRPVDRIKETVATYIEGRLEKKGRLKDLALNARDIEQAAKDAFGTGNIDDIVESIRK